MLCSSTNTTSGMKTAIGRFKNPVWCCNKLLQTRDENSTTICFPNSPCYWRGKHFCKDFHCHFRKFLSHHAHYGRKGKYLQIIPTPSSYIKLQNAILRSLVSFKSPVWLVGLFFFLPKCIMLSATNTKSEGFTTPG